MRKFNAKKLLPNKKEEIELIQKNQKPSSIKDAFLIQFFSVVIISLILVLEIVNISITKPSLMVYSKYSVSIDVSDLKAESFKKLNVSRSELKNIVCSEELNEFIGQTYYEKINALLGRNIEFTCDEIKLRDTLNKCVEKYSNTKAKNEVVDKIIKKSDIDEIIETDSKEQYQIKNYIEIMNNKRGNYSELKQESENFFNKVRIITSPIMIILLFFIFALIQIVNYIRLKSFPIALLQMASVFITPSSTIFILAIGKIFFAEDSMYAINIAAISIAVSLTILIVFIPTYLLCKNLIVRESMVINDSGIK